MTAPNVDPTEDVLIARAIRGDVEARRELFERFREAAYAAALRVTGRPEDALDVVQDAFIKAFESLAGFARGASFKTWLLRIVTNRALDLLRAAKVRRAVSLDQRNDGHDRDAMPDPPSRADEHETPGAGLERTELGERLARAVATLPPEQRAVFALYADGDLTYADIARIVGIPIGTVMSRLFHARRRLTELLGDLAPAVRRKD
ncbi:MAG: sigma-70 family RNA polymerase sigma factor [Planctomycetia bacterium]|nr:MAG: sigma-70 family RNA polymerase sigma factor [Planctomycetia bacterium]